jgi:hypothetical protein
MHDIPIAMAAKEIAIRLDMALSSFLGVAFAKARSQPNREAHCEVSSGFAEESFHSRTILIVVSIVLSRCALHHKKTLPAVSCITKRPIFTALTHSRAWRQKEEGQAISRSTFDLQTVSSVWLPGHHRWQPITLALRPAVFDRHVLAIDVTGFAQPFEKA